MKTVDLMKNLEYAVSLQFLDRLKNNIRINIGEKIC